MSLISWLITSSSNPAAMGMTVRGVLVVLVPLIAGCIGLDDASSNALVEGLVQLVVAGMTLIGVSMTVFGLVRKLYLQRWSHPDA